MKILNRRINLARDRKSGEGSVRLEAEEDEDMYHLYNLIFVGDTVEAMTIRNVINCSSLLRKDTSLIIYDMMLNR